VPAAARLIGGRVGRSFEPAAGPRGQSVLIPPDLAHGVWLEFAQRNIR